MNNRIAALLAFAGKDLDEKMEEVLFDIYLHNCTRNQRKRRIRARKKRIALRKRP